MSGFPFAVEGRGPFRGEIEVPGDKSISHRAVIFGSLARGTTRVRGFLRGEDALATLAAFRNLGIRIDDEASDEVILHGGGWDGLRAPLRDIDCGNSGTLARLILGVLAAQPFASRLLGDASLSRRPMGRVVRPLQEMGARIFQAERARRSYHLPLEVWPRTSPLRAIHFTSAKPSAQVKSCLILAGCHADLPGSFTEPDLSRDHTERMMASFGAPLKRRHYTVTIRPRPRMEGCEIRIPGDISSAAFFLVGAAITPGSDLTIRNVGLNPTRIGIVRLLQRMGAALDISDPRMWGGEPVGDLRIRHSRLRATALDAHDVLLAIDELPIFCLAAASAEGTTEIRGAAELRVKESDRLASTTALLRGLGAAVEERSDGLAIDGGEAGRFAGTNVRTHFDHRIAMTAAVAASVARGPIGLEETDSIRTSFPGFFDLLERATPR